MNKRTRFVILLAVLAICFVFLWPSISWYARTPKEVQQLALGSTENIKNYAESKAAEDVRTIKDLAKDSSAVLDGDYAWLNKAAAKQYKSYGEKAPENMTVTEHFSEFPMMRPCCGLDKEEIIRTAEQIDTYETSILPYEDCCVLFSPRHPVLRGTPDAAEDIYKTLEVDDLIEKAYNEREIVKLTFGDEPSWKC